MNQLMCKNVATACSVVVLAFGLAACSSSTKKPADGNGGTPPANGGTPPADEMDSELKQQQDAAKAAETAAKAASDLASQGMAASDDDPAKTGADAAQTAVMNLVSIQLPAKAKMYADEAKAAAEAAKEAYDLAKAAAAKAAAATSVLVATEARIDAEEAQKDAEAQAKTANDKAQMAVDEAQGIAYADGTYTVGAMSITPGPERTTQTVDGKSLTTGRLGSDDGISQKTVYRAADESSGPELTVTTKVTHMVADRRERILHAETIATPSLTARATPAGGLLASPEIPAGREVRVSHMYDSEDDKSRLWLVTHYMGKATVGFFYREATEVIATVDQEDDAPYGRWAKDDTNTDYAGGPKVVRKAEGNFYLASSGSVTSGRIWNGSAYTFSIKVGEEEEVLEEGDVFYVLDDRNEPANPANNRRTWLELVSTTTKPDGTKSFQYKLIQAWTGDYRGDPGKVSVSDFPESIAYDHVNFGLWSMLDEAGKKPKELGIAFARAKQGGSMTAAAAMPTSGTATYNGSWAAHVRERAVVSGPGRVTQPSPISEQSGNSVVTADFAKNTVKVNLHQLAMLEGDISGNMFSGTKISDVKDGKGNLAAAADGSGFTGAFSGSFFGSAAEEVGGVFDYTSEDKGAFRGAFGGSKSGMPMAETVATTGGPVPGGFKLIDRRMDRLPE